MSNAVLVSSFLRSFTSVTQPVTVVTMSWAAVRLTFLVRFLAFRFFAWSRFTILILSFITTALSSANERAFGNMQNKCLILCDLQ